MDPQRWCFHGYSHVGSSFCRSQCMSPERMEDDGVMEVEWMNVVGLYTVCSSSELSFSSEYTCWKDGHSSSLTVGTIKVSMRNARCEAQDTVLL